MTSPSPDGVERELVPEPKFHLDHEDAPVGVAPQGPDVVFTGTPVCGKHGEQMTRDPDLRLYCGRCHIEWVAAMQTAEGG